MPDCCGEKFSLVDEFAIGERCAVLFCSECEGIEDELGLVEGEDGPVGFVGGFFGAEIVFLFVYSSHTMLESCFSS